MIGHDVGAYRITAKVGEGGMGAVYAAEHKLIGRRAAVKMLLPELSHKPEIVTRFFNEARAATAIKHPGIVEIYDFGYHANGSAFIVMEFLEGESLEARLRRVGRVGHVAAMATCSQVASALAAAHDAGIVHRDLKPDNVFLVPDPDMVGGERATILDFGIAKLTDDEHASSVKTRTGSLMGTPTYMSPEQCKGAGSVDARSDLYALGCILFELLIGRPPFVAEGAGEVLAQHIYQPPVAPRSIDPTIPPELDALVLSLLAKEPAGRPASAAIVKAALDRLSGRGSVPEAASAATMIAAAGRPPSTPTTLSAAAGVSSTAVTPERSGSRWVAPVVAGLVLAVAGVVFAVTRGGGAPEVTAASAPEPGPVDAPSPTPVGPPAPVPVEPPEPALPASITIQIESDPAGAVVYRLPHGNRLGTTPLSYDTERLDGQIEFLLKKRGYDDETVAVAADASSDARVILEKTSRSSSRPTRRPKKDPPTSAPEKPNPFDKKGRLDPFAK